MRFSHRGLFMLTSPAPDSNLMRSLVNTIKLKLPTPEHKLILPTATFEHIANLSFEQLTTLRHRGAFSTVTSTFAACCQACVDPKMDATSNQFLVRWLDVCLILSSYSVCAIANSSRPSWNASCTRNLLLAGLPAFLRPSLVFSLPEPQVHP